MHLNEQHAMSNVFAVINDNFLNYVDQLTLHRCWWLYLHIAVDDKIRVNQE